MADIQKLSKWAKEFKVSYSTAKRYYEDGKIPGAITLPSGNIVVDMEAYKKSIGIISENSTTTEPLKTIIYARVSSSQNKENLEGQSKRLQTYSEANGWSINEVVKDIGSGLNDSRSGLIKILKDKKPIRLVVEHKDRLTRFGFNYIKIAIENNGGEIHVVNEVEDHEDDIVQDFVSIITSFCARIYGHRRGKRKTEVITKELINE